MAKNNLGSGVEVIMEDLSGHPSCPHGPALLFRRQNTRFYACSACRNRKDCQFFMHEDEWIRKKRSTSAAEDLSRPNRYTFTIPKEDLILSAQTVEKVKLAPQLDRAYCHTCSTLFLISETSEKHHKHDVKPNIDSDLLSKPSRILKPLENDKKEAQYLFSPQAISTMIDVLTYNKLTNVVCLGTPSIHEHIQENCLGDGMTSILLDIDSRHGAFYKANKFCHYNIFNNYFFNGEQATTIFDEFLQKNGGKNMVLIMDPPFGGRIEPLAQTLREMSKRHREVNKIKNGGKDDALVPIILVLPYFMEPQIKNHAPFLEMCDYQITYDSHLNFKEQKASKHGSPVRLFTNIALKNFKLPTEDGYTFCRPCLKWIGDWNNHCNKCKSCTSKNGSTYVHCNTCQRCVKPSWEHCEYCNRCTLKAHYCGVVLKQQTCFNCKEVGHKKADCPKAEVEQPKKRKHEKGIEVEIPKKMARLEKKKPVDFQKDTGKPEPAKPKRNKKKERKARLKLNRKIASDVST